MNKLEETRRAFYQTLKEFNVGAVFHLPGSVSVPLYEKIEEFNPILMKSPVAAGYAADAYARLKGMGVAIVAQGPGLAGVLPAVIQSWKDHVPLVVISGKPVYMEGDPHSWQAFPAGAMLKPVAKAFIDIWEGYDPYKSFKHAFEVATTPPSGPVVINICETKPRSSPKLVQTTLLPFASKQFLEGLFEGLEAAKKPLILAGGGAIRDSKLLATLIDKIKIPLVTTTLGRGVVDEANSRVLGPVGTIGFDLANKAMCEADFILALGTRLSRNVIQPIVASQSKPVICQIAGNPSDRSTIVSQDKFRVLDVASVIDGLMKFQVSTKDWIRKETSKPTLKNEVLNKVYGCIGVEDVLTIDAGTMALVTHKSFIARKPNHLLYQWGMGTMGTSLPASIGIALSGCARKVFVVTGDGGLLAGLSELTTIAERKLPVKIAVFNNHGLEFIRNIQRQSLGKDKELSYEALDLFSISKSMGIDAFKISGSNDMTPEILNRLQDNKPLVLDIETAVGALDLKGTQWDKK